MNPKSIAIGRGLARLRSEQREWLDRRHGSLALSNEEMIAHLKRQWVDADGERQALHYKASALKQRVAELEAKLRAIAAGGST